MWSYFGLIFSYITDVRKWSYSFATRHRFTAFIGGYVVMITALINLFQSKIVDAYIPIPDIIQQAFAIFLPDNFVSVLVVIATARLASSIFLAKFAVSAQLSSALGSGDTGEGSMPNQDEVPATDDVPC